jgi:hypothetical protein
VQFEEKISITSSPEKIFGFYADVEGWSLWDPDVKKSSIEGEFVSGAQGTLLPSKGPQARVFFTEVIPNSSFTVESKLPFCTMRFEHEITNTHNGSVGVVHRVSFRGFLAPLFGRLIGSQIEKGFPNTLLGLKKAAEKNC